MATNRFTVAAPAWPRKNPPPPAAPASVPVNIPDWSKILGDEYRRRNNVIDDEDEGYDVERSTRVPPHEFLARTRVASFSVHEGVGRTLKGRDLSTLRNAIWAKTGFQD
ncbi:Senescence regulator S40 [Spatholobus suberectus]|nr:Senescence regulator S40 [Spatholobus suberectus]